MNHTVTDTPSTFGVGMLCFVLSIIVLSVFFLLLARLSAARIKQDSIPMSGVLTKDSWVTVHVSGAKPFERVRFIGFTNNQLPYYLSNMVILESAEGRRYLIREKVIKMIVMEPQATGDEQTGATNVV
jgi:hypothetical protein